MSFIAFLSTLKKYLIPAYSWLKARITNPSTGKSLVVSEKNVSNIFSKQVTGDIKITQVNLNLFFDKENPNYNPEVKREFIEELTRSVERHEGIGVSFDESFLILRSTSLTPQQRAVISVFRKCEWPEDILSSLSVSYKIINLEDNGQYERAKKLMYEAFRGRSGTTIKKLYNLGRAGYIDEFVLNAKISPLSYDKKWILDTLNYFPEAIFLYDESIPQDVITELHAREVRGIKMVTLYARGTKIDTLNKGYSEYIDKKVSISKGSERPAFLLYTIYDNEDYTIAWSRAKTLKVKLERVREVPTDQLSKLVYGNS